MTVRTRVAGHGPDEMIRARLFAQRRKAMAHFALFPAANGVGA